MLTKQQFIKKYNTLTPEQKQELKFKDIYKFPIDYNNDYCIEMIKEDLKLIAGGGYNYKHIHNIKFEITEVLQNEKN